MDNKMRVLFVGCGAMGSAILSGALQAGIFTKEEVHVVEHTEDKVKSIEDTWGVSASVAWPNLADFTLIVLAVKPQVLPSVLPKMQAIASCASVVSIAAGISLKTLTKGLQHEICYRAMPNIGVSIGHGFTALTDGKDGDTVPKVVQDIFTSIGEVVLVSEDNLECIGAVCGAGIGYAFVLIDAMADAGVSLGMPRTLAIQAAAAAFWGAGAMTLETGEHPAVLRDKVTSPGGTTIAGILAMEQAGARSALQQAIIATYNRAKELEKQ